MPESLFYIILRGTVSVNIDVKSIIQQETKNGIVEQEIIENVKIRELNKGESFGELALIDKNPRSANIVCLKDCDFITLDKNSFNKILKSYQITKLNEELTILKKSPLFQFFQLNTLKQIFLLFQVNNYVKDEYVIQEGQISDKIYFIKNGEFRITKSVLIKIEDEEQCFLNKNAKQTKIQMLKIGILGAFQTFGEEEFFTNDKRQFRRQNSRNMEFFYGSQNKKYKANS
ncbi:hypothetical protein IMG5_005060 [Ichthyophthirius multifiliis]|uniref:Cyclic nucleotide-binding domain-containing protein n=1 Tax=Ichthyophthirius multifiliis TaxID=5932 RepID=G0QJF4_ICHMU|nr:hypothetical protein IMG5_005060 [Ichthyophthirius multifiliis]EGR34641.1 hypothetical protein IMG5_005060 [Ichthyophthirius multifiliis]|eukprot:XP_004039945.1 hypothetical protein IMG5_005060 [Ichthyophthirius multifiliis]